MNPQSSPQPQYPTQPQQPTAVPYPQPQAAPVQQPPTPYPQPQAGGMISPQPAAPQPNQAPKNNTASVKPKSAPNSTQNSLHIAEIRDGIVIMNDGSFRAVVMIKPVNFDLMSPQEKENVEYGYQGFLNSLYFPVQIFIHSEKVDIRPYLQKLEQIRVNQDNMLLAILMDDYINFMVQIAQQTNIMEKSFYIVVPYEPLTELQKAINPSASFFSGLADLFKPSEKKVTINEADLAKAQDELKHRVEAILGGLAQSNIQGLPLDTEELIELYYNTYNPDTAVRQPIKDYYDLTAPIVSKGEGIAPQPNNNQGVG